MSPQERRRPGTGQEAPEGSGKDRTLGVAQPGVDTAAMAGVPGEVRYGDGPVQINAGREVTTVRVVNTGDRPITVGSHYHFAEANPALEFDRRAAWGKRQNIIAGGMTRFDPGTTQDVELVPFVGRRIAAGFRGECGGRSMNVDRVQYVSSLGPTVGDQLRLADTDLFIEVEKDLCVGGDEVVFGGGKSGRESQGQSHTPRSQGAPDLVVTNVVILDHWGVVKADVGIRDGRFVAIGKSGNPDIMDGVHPDLVIGPSTELMNGNGMIMTAGGIDTHVHMVSPAMCPVALQAGVTTLVGGGSGPTDGSKATLATPGAWWLARMFEAFDPWPVNVAFLARGSTVSQEALWEQLRAGAAGFKCHEDWGASPTVIDAALRVADEAGVQVAIHSDTLNEAGFVEQLMRTVAGRTFHSYHTEGAGGGHAPDIIRVASEANVLPSSTTPTRPFTTNTVDEQLDMILVAHQLNPKIPAELGFAESRVRATTIAAEDILQDIGAISAMSSDAQAMGRLGETLLRTWQTAHVMKGLRGPLPGDGRADNARARRYVAKYTICPAVIHGLEHEIGSIEAGKLADFVLWEPPLFGVKPSSVFKGGMAAVAMLGDPNASVPTPQPVLPRLGYNVHTRAAQATSVAFVSPAALEDGLAERLAVHRPLVAVQDVRGRTKADLPLNDTLPRIEVNPDTFAVHIDGELVDRQPPSQLPMTQRYFLY